MAETASKEPSTCLRNKHMVSSNYTKVLEGQGVLVVFVSVPSENSTQITSGFITNQTPEATPNYISLPHILLCIIEIHGSSYKI